MKMRIYGSVCPKMRMTGCQIVVLSLDNFVGDGLPVAECGLADADTTLGRVELTAVNGEIFNFANETVSGVLDA